MNRNSLRTLDTYQVELAEDLLSALCFGPQGMLVSPTGSGKTIVARVTAEDLMRLGRYDGALVLVPQNQIKSSWSEEARLRFPPVRDPGVIVVRDELDFLPGEWDHNHIGRVMTKNDRDHLKNWMSTPSPVPKGYISTHQGFSRWAKGPGFLPPDLSHRLLIIDEAHRACKDNQLGSAIAKWMANGGSTLYVTATPFRTQGSLPVAGDLIPAYRSLAEHVSSGHHSPRNIFIRSRQFSYQTKSARDLSGDVMPAGDLDQLADELRDLWIADGKPKAVVVVPIYGSGRWADRFAKSLQGVARVHIAVGMEGHVQGDFIKLLDREREAAKNGSSSEVDVIVACKRFDEGTDWPWCSHIYNLGLPSALGLIIQRLGRTLRYKGGNPDSPRKGIQGYDKRHQDCSVMTFMLPKDSAASWDAFETKHKDAAFLTACFMQDTNTGREYLAEIRNRIADVGRACPSNAQANLRVWRQIGNAVGMELDDTKALYADLKRACILVGKDNPTDTELQTFMTTRMGFDQEKVKTVLFARDLRKKMGNPLVLRALDARVTQAQLGSRSGGVDRRIIRETLQAAFDDVVDESVTDNADLVQEAKATLEIQTQFTGEDAKVIAGRMQERLDTVVVPLTLDQIKAGILAHHTRIGNAPRRSEDASLDFGFPITWSGIDQRLVLQGRSLRLLCSELGLPVAYPGIDLSVDLVTDGALEPEEWECPYE